MIVYIACAKIMTGTAPRKLPFTTVPVFQSQANENAVKMASFSAGQLKRMLKVNDDIAKENWLRYQHFFDEDNVPQPAAFAYDGMVFRKLAPETFTDEELRYANSHLFIGSFLYGLLRPLDMIKKYRLEGNVVFPGEDGSNMCERWKPLLTDYFISQIKADDGVLVNLASYEMRDLFDWKKVEREVQVITPEFQVMKEGKPKTIVIYAKMCRGAMTRFILKNRIVNPFELLTFEYEGFRCDSENDYRFVL
jgi:cytoplasmic iron level regulating protein YaaA (DUF328/UPF0246 family)